MKRYHLLWTAAVCCGLVASAFGWGNLVSSFDCPSGSTYPNGVACRDGYIYIATNTPDKCFRTTTTGSVVYSHKSPTNRTMGCAAGVIGASRSYWVVSGSNTMYRIAYNSGSIYDTFSLAGGYPYGTSFRQVDSDYFLYYTDRYSKTLYRLNALTGSIRFSFSLDFPPNDCAFDSHGYIWIADSTARVIRQCRYTGSVCNSFSVASYGYPGGVGYDGTYVWVGICDPLHRILKFEVYGDPVGPTSFGKVKAVFR